MKLDLTPARASYVAPTFGGDDRLPIDPSLHGRCALPTTVLGKVVIEVDPARPVPKAAELNADLAQQ